MSLSDKESEIYGNFQIKVNAKNDSIRKNSEDYAGGWIYVFCSKKHVVIFWRKYIILIFMYNIFDQLTTVLCGEYIQGDVQGLRYQADAGNLVISVKSQN